MTPRLRETSRLASILVRLAIALAGVATIVASSGGGIGVAGCGDYCKPIEPTGPTPSALLSPAGQTVQVGTPAVFRVQVSNLSNPLYQWCRSAAASQPCVAIPEATGSAYTIASARLEDDGARFQVTVTGNGGFATSGFSELAVSSMPGVIFQDGEFAAAAWSTTARIAPAQGQQTYRLSRNAAGGNPDAYLGIDYRFDAINESTNLDHVNLAARYDPASQGAIHRLDFAEDCIRTASAFLPGVVPLIEQGGRLYGARSNIAYCASDSWQPSSRPSLQRSDFQLVAGPACGIGETCPDFSATAAPIRFGLTTNAALTTLPPVGSAVEIGQGVDNWKVTVWRK